MFVEICLAVVCGILTGIFTGLDDGVIELLDLDHIYLELLKYKDLKKYSNMYFTKQDIREILQKKKYVFLCKKEILQIIKTDELRKLTKIHDYVVQLLKTYIDKSFNHEKYHWYQHHPKYESVSQEDGSLIPKEYVFTINANAHSLIKDIRDFTKSSSHL